MEAFSRQVSKTDVLSIYDKLSHLYGECPCGKMEFATIVDKDGVRKK